MNWLKAKLRWFFLGGVALAATVGAIGTSATVINDNQIISAIQFAQDRYFAQNGYYFQVLPTHDFYPVKGVRMTANLEKIPTGRREVQRFAPKQIMELASDYAMDFVVTVNTCERDNLRGYEIVLERTGLLGREVRRVNGGVCLSETHAWRPELRVRDKATDVNAPVAWHEYLFKKVFAADSHSADWGATAYATANDAASLDIGATEDFTFEVWYRPADNPQGDINGAGSVPYDSNTLASKWQAGQTREYHWEYGHNGTSYELCAATTDDGTTNAGHFKVACQTMTQLTLNTWYYLAVTYDDATGNFTFYRGDEATCPTSLGTVSGGFGIGAGTSRLAMAQGDNTSATNADGLFGEYRLWRAERTSTEISDNMEPESISSGTGLLGVWKFNNNFTDDINGNNLTGVNSPTFTTTIPTITATCPAVAGGTVQASQLILFN